MADRDGVRIGLVRGARFVGEPEDQLHHALHLRLVRPPVAAHGLLDARRSVLSAVEPGLGGRDEHDASRLPDGERDAGVGTHVGLLERDGVGRVLRNESPNSLEDRQQPHVERLPRGRPPAARPHRPEAPVASVDDPVPARSRPWVDAEDLHEWKLRGSPDVPPAGSRSSRRPPRSCPWPTPLSGSPPRSAPADRATRALPGAAAPAPRSG